MLHLNWLKPDVSVWFEPYNFLFTFLDFSSWNYQSVNHHAGLFIHEIRSFPQACMVCSWNILMGSMVVGFPIFQKFVGTMLANKYATVHGAHKFNLKCGLVPFDRHEKPGSWQYCWSFLHGCTHQIGGIFSLPLSLSLYIYIYLIIYIYIYFSNKPM